MPKKKKSPHPKTADKRKKKSFKSRLEGIFEMMVTRNPKSQHKSNGVKFWREMKKS